jgi:cyclohexa-1,5-dienecarbonyl-CoA hydratase
VTSARPVISRAPLHDGALWTLTLDAPPGNILDIAMLDALTAQFRAAAGEPSLKAVIVVSSSPDFSWGASVHEHLPETCEAMLASFHELLRAILEAGVVTLAGIRGRCLGGGLELAAFCHRVFASEAATFGQPEIRLGVFAPFASIILPERMGRGGAEDLLLSGRTIDAAEAHRLGLVDALAADPEAAAAAYVEHHLLLLSASSLRHATRAARAPFATRLAGEYPHLRSRYLFELMKSPDAREGLRAFIEKRPPGWRNR